MSDSERGNTTHGPRMDEQLEQEARGMVQGHGAPHAEPFRETEPLPDDTDAPDVERAFRHDTAPGSETEDAALEHAPVDAPANDDLRQDGAVDEGGAADA